MEKSALLLPLSALLIFGCLTPTQSIPVPTVGVVLPAPSASATPGTPATPSPLATIPPEGTASLNQPFTLAIGQTVSFERATTFTFVNVTGDSRCPTGVQCIWAGIVTVEVRLDYDGKSETFPLTAGAIATSRRTVDGFSVHVLGVEPYPEYPDHIPLNEYRATFTVSKA